jgi:IMP dehydrogenase
MAAKSNGSLPEALTFDDVLLRPGLSEVLPTETDVRTRITREIALNIPIITSAMDTVTEAPMAIALAQAGGLGVIHRNLEPEQQAALVRQVKKFESGMVVNPLTIEPGATLADALLLMKQNGISGIPVVEGGGPTSPGRLRDLGRCASADEAERHLRDPGGRGRRADQPGQARRHPHQPRRPLRH